MKRKFYYLFTLALILLCTSCKQENDYTEEIDKITSSLQNDVAIYLLQQMKTQLGSYENLKEKLNGNKAAFEQVVVSSSSQYGLFYAIPYTQYGIIEGCIIYPVDESLPCKERALYGSLGNPILIDSHFINSLPENQKYLLSVQFLEWLEKGNDNINSSLYSHAKFLEKEDQKIKESYSPQNKYQSLTRGYSDEAAYANVHLDYKTTYSSIYDKNGNCITVTAPSVQGIMSVLKDAIEMNYSVIEAQISHKIGQSLYIHISFNKIINTYQFKALIKEAMQAVTTSYYSKQGKVAFSTQYTYTYHINKNDSEHIGGGIEGVPGAFHGGTHYNDNYETEKPPIEKPVKTAIIDCNSKTSEQKMKVNNIFSLLDKVKPDDTYQQYIKYSDYLNAVSERDSLEHATSLLEFDDGNGEINYRCSPIRTGSKNSVYNDTGSSNLVVIIHNHPNGTPPSFQDVITTSEVASRSDTYKFQGSLIYNKMDNSYYMLYVTDKGKASKFMNKYKNELDKETNWIKKNGNFRDVIRLAQKSFKKMSENDKLMHTLAFIFSEYDAGLNICYINKDRKTSIHYCKETTKDINKEKKYITPLKCE